MKRRVISLLLSVMMVLLLIPSMAFADSTEAGSAEPAGGTDLEAADSDASFDFSADQTAINDTGVTVKIPDLQRLIQSNAFDTINVDAKLLYNGQTAKSETFTKKAGDFAGTDDSFEVRFPIYGKWNVDVTFSKNGETVSKNSTVVPVIAENYNITVMCATLPVLILTLKELGGALPEGPLVLAVERYWSFNWDKLPEGIYANPLWDGRGYEQDTTKAYAEMLYEISPDSHFYFYINDYWIERDMVNVLWKNPKIPEDHYSVRYITDGTATYAAFRQVYGDVEDAAARHDEMVEEVKAAKAKALAGEEVDFDHMKYGKLSHYCYALLDVEEGTEWWVVRKSIGDTFAIKDSAFADRFNKDTRVTSNYINNLLKTVQNNGKEEVFRDLYKFDDEAFEATRAKGKKIMMVLGTSKAGEESVPLDNYVKLIQAYYGDDYEYYYKGHPGYVPELNPGRKEELENMGFQILDSSIAAEIFLFFDPDIVLSGYQSSTYASASGDQGCVFNMSKAEAETAPGGIPYTDFMDMFATDMRTKSVADEATLRLVRNPDHHNYFIEFRDTTKYDFGIFDADTDELYFIKDGAIVEDKPEPVVKTVTDLPSVRITKVTKAKKAFTVKWKKISANNRKKIAYVQIRYSTDRNFSKNVGNVYVKKTAVSKTIKKLKSKKLISGKTYYVKIRAYKKVNNTTHVSKWSGRWRVKVK